MSTGPLIGLDTDDFGILRRNKQVYVDKTAYIQQMLETRMRYVFLARPRRFGKSLLVSTLAHLFGRKNDELFQGLAIAESGYLAQVPQVPVVSLNMSNVAGSSPQGLRDSLLTLVRMEALRLDIEPPDAAPWDALNWLFFHLHDRQGTFAVLVDEYDSPLTGAWTRSNFSDADRRETEEDLRAFYRTLKNWNQAVRFVFVTGILHLENAGLFSALNNLRNLSGMVAWGELCGFTEDEIKNDLGEHIALAAQNLGVSVEDMLNRLRYYYNGYRFAVTQKPVYNPISVLTALETLASPADARETELAGLPHAWLSLGQTQLVHHYLREHKIDLRHFDFGPAGATSAINLRRPRLNALLYQTGFLTQGQSKEGAVYLDYPNWEVEITLKEGLFFSYFGLPVAPDNPEWTFIQDMGAALQAHDCARALNAFDSLLHRVAYEELKAESNYQLALHLACALCQSVLRVDAEVMGRRGRSDIVVETRDTFYVFELKLNRSHEEALDQIRSRAYLAKYEAEGKRAIGIGVNFTQRKAEEREADADRRAYTWDSLPSSGTEMFKGEYPAAESERNARDG